MKSKQILAEALLSAAAFLNTTRTAFPQATPVSVGHFGEIGSAYSIAVAGHHAYVADEIDGLGIYDISNPTNILSVGQTNDGGYAQGVVISGHFAYLANSSDGLRIYTVSNPAMPINVGHAYDGGYANWVAVAGNYAY